MSRTGTKPLPSVSADRSPAHETKPRLLKGHDHRGSSSRHNAGLGDGYFDHSYFEDSYFEDAVHFDSEELYQAIDRQGMDEKENALDAELDASRWTDIA